MPLHLRNLTSDAKCLLSFFLRSEFPPQGCLPRVTISPPDAVVHHIDATLPVRVVVLVQDSFVCPRLDHQAPVAVVNVLHGGPGGHDPVGRPEGEIVEVLVERVARSPGPSVRRLVDQHGVHDANVLAGKALDVVQ